jgi:hypothetical protein
MTVLVVFKEYISGWKVGSNQFTYKSFYKMWCTYWLGIRIIHLISAYTLTFGMLSVAENTFLLYCDVHAVGRLFTAVAIQRNN